MPSPKRRAFRSQRSRQNPISRLYGFLDGALEHKRQTTPHSAHRGRGNSRVSPSPLRALHRHPEGKKSPLRPFSLAPVSEPRGEGKLSSRHDQFKKSRAAQRGAVPPRFQPRPPSPKISWPVAVTAIVSSSLIKPRFGCFIVVSTEITMPASSGRSAS